MRIEKILRTNSLNRLFILAISLLGLSHNSFADFSIEGHYQGKSIYVQSPADEDGFGYCINKVILNGEIIPVDVYASAFEIDLSQYNIEQGQEVLLVFEHDEGCKPKLLNPEALRPKSTFVLEEISCSPEGMLSWSTTNESGKLNYLIEQYKWNKWVVVGEVTGIGTPELNHYSFNVLAHSGENVVRLAQIDNTSQKRVTQEVSFMNDAVPQPELRKVKDEKKLEFEVNGEIVKTKYEIFDSFGNIVKKGYNSMVDYSNLKPGMYYVNYDNKNDRIVVK